MLPHVSRAPRSSLFPYTTLFRSSAVGVSCGASGARSSVAKIPAARSHADAVVGSGDKSEALSDYGVRRGGGRSHGTLGADSYGGAVCRGHTEIVGCSHGYGVASGISIVVCGRASGGGWRAVAEVPVARDWEYSA